MAPLWTELDGIIPGSTYFTACGSDRAFFEDILEEFRLDTVFVYNVSAQTTPPTLDGQIKDEIRME